jgi:hypothetical protein
VTGGIKDDIPSGEVVQAYFLGQYPVTTSPVSHHPEFPEGMSTERLFPEVSSEYTNPKTGISNTVNCYIPGVEAAVAEIVCPFPFVRPIDQERDPRPCILPW